VAAVNLLLGWTLIGWAVAVAMALSKPAELTVIQAPASSAGWYPDPTNPAISRYWDGRGWTHVCEGENTRLTG
jgi:hypothetical protein